MNEWRCRWYKCQLWYNLMPGSRKWSRRRRDIWMPCCRKRVSYFPSWCLQVLAPLIILSEYDTFHLASISSQFREYSNSSNSWSTHANNSRKDNDRWSSLDIPLLTFHTQNGHMQIWPMDLYSVAWVHSSIQTFIFCIISAIQHFLLQA